MKQKIIMKVQMNCDKCRTKALKVAAVADGVVSVAIRGADKDDLVVTGDEVDTAELVRALRKKVGHAKIISVLKQAATQSDGEDWWQTRRSDWSSLGYEQYSRPPPPPMMICYDPYRSSGDGCSIM